MLAVATALLATVACGARLNSAQYLEARGAGAGGTGGVSPSRSGAATAGAGGASNAGGGATAGGSTGGQTPAAGGGGTGSGGGGAAACAPQHSDAPGVSDTEIKLGNVSTISGPVQNFG